MKILFCSKNDIFGATILNFILPQLAGHQVKVLLSDKTRSEENKVPELVDEKFLERELPLDLLFPLIDAQPLHGQLLTFKGCAHEYGVSIQTIQNINAPESEQRIRDWAPDIIVSARFSLIFKGNIEQIPPHGIFNIHPGALPGYAGLCAPLRGILNGDDMLGCTLHKVDMGIDTGPIYSVSYMPSKPPQSVFAHIGNLYQMGLTSLLDLLKDIAAGNTPVLRVQDKAAFRYYHLPEEHVFEDMRARNIKPVSFEVYGELLRKFCPEALVPAMSILFDPATLEQDTAAIHAHGTAPVIERLRDAIHSRLTTSE